MTPVAWLATGLRRLDTALLMVVTAALAIACAPQPTSIDSGSVAPSTPPTSAPLPTAPPTAPPAAPPTTGPGRATSPEAAPVRARQPDLLRRGDSGADVRDLQRRLVALGYWLGEPDGRYGHLTEQAVLALQKAAGVNRDGVFGPRTRAALRHGAQPQQRRVVGSGVEVDLTRQLLLYVRDGVLTTTLNASTGSGASYVQNGTEQIAITPTGRFTVYRDVDAEDNGPLGPLWRPKYIVGGIAIHGYAHVPAQPASHGCVRVSIAAMDHLWAAGVLPIGASVWVY